MNNLRILSVLFLTLLLASCGGKKNIETATDSDTTSVEDAVEEAADTTYYLTSENLGPVIIGERMTAMPESCDRLYTSRVHADSHIGNVVAFYDNEEQMFTIFDYMEGNVDMIVLDSPRIKVAAPGGDIALGDSFMNILSLPSVEAEWIQDDDGTSGKWFWTWSGLWFGIDESHLTEKLSSHLYNGATQPMAEDFDETVRIGYIGTGLPY